MEILAGQTPLALRQASANTFSGEKAQDAAAKAYDTFVYPDTGIIQYADPDNKTLKALTKGGLYDFGDQCVQIKEIRALAASGDISVVVGDRDNADHDTIVAVPATGRIIEDIVVLPSQVLKVSTASATAKGFIDVYIVKGDWF